MGNRLSCPMLHGGRGRCFLDPHPRGRLTEEGRATVLALSVAARGIAVWGADGLLARLATMRAVVSAA